MSGDKDSTMSGDRDSPTSGGRDSPISGGRDSPMSGDRDSPMRSEESGASGDRDLPMRSEEGGKSGDRDSPVRGEGSDSGEAGGDSGEVCVMTERVRRKQSGRGARRPSSNCGSKDAVKTQSRDVKTRSRLCEDSVRTM